MGGGGSPGEDWVQAQRSLREASAVPVKGQGHLRESMGRGRWQGAEECWAQLPGGLAL